MFVQNTKFQESRKYIRTILPFLSKRRFLGYPAPGLKRVGDGSAAIRGTISVPNVCTHAVMSAGSIGS